MKSSLRLLSNFLNILICIVITLTSVYIYNDLYPPKQQIEVLHQIDQVTREITKEVIVTQTTNAISRETYLNALKSTVRIKAPDGAQASGVLIASVTTDSKVYYNYVLSCAHFIRDFNSFTVERFSYYQDRLVLEKTLYENVEIANKNEFFDVSILQFKTDKKLEPISLVTKPQDMDKVGLCEPIFTCGCPLGSEPFITDGYVASFESKMGSLQISTPIMFGNSGGPVFSKDGKVLGIVIRINFYPEMDDLKAGLYPNMGYAVPAWDINVYMRANKLGFILGYKDGSSISKLNRSMRKDREARIEKEFQDLLDEQNPILPLPEKDFK